MTVSFAAGLASLYGRGRRRAAYATRPVRCAVPGIGIAIQGTMRGDSGRTRSPWFASANTPPRPPLAGDSRAEVCVIGAGMAGLSVAYHLAVEGRSVLVLDEGPIGGGQSGRTTAHLSDAIDDLYVEIASPRRRGRAAGCRQPHGGHRPHRVDRRRRPRPHRAPGAPPPRLLTAARGAETAAELARRPPSQLALDEAPYWPKMAW